MPKLMSRFEAITTILSVIAIGLSIYTLVFQRRLQKESNELQRATAELARRQLATLSRDEEERGKAKLIVDVQNSATSDRFVITNVGATDARDVNFELLLDEANPSPLVDTEYREKLPAPKLSPGQSISLIAALDDQSPSRFKTRLSWLNPDGTVSNKVTYITS